MPLYYNYSTYSTTGIQQWYIPTYVTSASTLTYQPYHFPTPTITTTSMTVTADVIWTKWLSDLNPRYVVSTAPPRIMTDEERAVAAQLVVQREAEMVAARVARHAAQVKASRLLDLVLSDEQRAELAEHRRFHVKGSRGRRFCIHANGQSGNVVWEDDAGKMLGRFCAHPTGYLPDADAWLAQALALQTDEDEFLRVANVHAGVRPSGLLVV